MEQPAITISHPTILAFYQENSHLDITAMNLILIDILKTLSTNLSSTINTTLNSQILSIVSNIDKNINTMKTDLLLQFNERINQTKKDYLEDLKTQLSNGFLSNHDKITFVLDKTSESILSKTSAIIHEFIPRSNDHNFKQIEQCIRSCCTTIEQDTKRILETNEKDSNGTNLLETLENNFSKMVSSMQTPLLHLIQTSEERTSSGIQRVQNEFLQQQVNHERLASELREFLNKYKNNSSTKGAVSEQELYYMLQAAMPTDEILDVSSLSETCDFRVNRMDHRKPTILFENKDYQRQVRTDEVTKFERDLQAQQMHGIFLSQQSPITRKENFHIDIINGIIHVYLSNVHYNVDKLKIAIDIIDNLAPKIASIQKNKMEATEWYVQKQDLDELVEEYQQFAIQKASIKETMATMSKKLLDKLDHMQLPKIKELLVRCGIVENDLHKCPYCQFITTKKASLSQHQRTCKPINGPQANNLESHEQTLSEQTIVEDPAAPAKKKAKAKK